MKTSFENRSLRVLLLTKNKVIRYRRFLDAHMNQKKVQRRKRLTRQKCVIYVCYGHDVIEHYPS